MSTWIPRPIHNSKLSHFHACHTGSNGQSNDATVHGRDDSAVRNAIDKSQCAELYRTMCPRSCLEHRSNKVFGELN